MEVIGDILGELEGLDDQTLGDVLGAAAVVAKRRGGRHLALAPKPSWRAGQLAPGVMAPQEGMIPLPMVPQTNSGTFTSAFSAITWLGRLQKPYRAERLLVTTVRTGATAVGRLLGQIFVGTDLQQATIQGFDLEVLGNPQAFGTRLTLLQAPPGVEINIPVVLSSNLTNPDTIFATVMFSGRVVQ